MIKLNLKNVFLITLLLISMFLVFLPQAQALQINNYPSFLNLNAISNSTNQLATLVSTIFKFLLMMAGLAAFVMIVWGGVNYLTSAGDPSKMGDANDQIFKAILGLVVIFASWMILNTINPQLVALQEPGTPSAKAPELVPKPVVAGNCAKDQAYAVKLYSEVNYRPTEDPMRCYNELDRETSFNKKIYSISVKEPVAVKLFDKPDFRGKNICFVSPQASLTNCYIDCPPGIFAWACNATWPGAVKSLLITSAEYCKSPGQTIGADGTKDGNEVCK